MKNLCCGLLVWVVLAGAQSAFCAGQEEAQRQQLTAHYLSQLDHAKMQKLMQRVGKQAPKSFYNCLCKADGGGAAMGVGVSYHPEPVKPYDKRYSCNHEGPPCMASGMGCWRFPLPNDEKMWAACLKNYPLEDATPIDAAVVNAANNTGAGTLAGGTSQLSRLTSDEERLLERLLEYRKLCLPNVEKKIEDIVLWSGKGGAIVKHALDKAAGSSNVCEEAVTVSLFLKGQDGMYPMEVMGEAIWPFVPYSSTINLFLPLFKGESLTPDDISHADIFNDLTDNALSGLKNPTNITNVMSALETLDKAYSTYKLNRSFREASDLFVQSQAWTQEKRDRFLLENNAELRMTKQKIVRINNKLRADLEAILPTVRQQQVVGTMFNPPGTKIPNDNPLWQSYFRKQEQLYREAAVAQGPLYSRIIDLNIHRQALTYREALRVKGCEQFLAESKMNCQK
ncbi:MAG: hypothetical protein AB7E77_02295 [Desulfobulbus sp.]